MFLTTTTKKRKQNNMTFSKSFEMCFTKIL